MKTKLMLPLIILFAVSAQAHLQDLTPGGFNVDDGLPPAFFRAIEQTFFDSAARGFFDLPEGTTYLNGWVSRFGRLNGADWFDTNLFEGDTTVASVSWDLANQQDGFWLSTIFVAGIGGWTHIYGVTGNERFLGEGIVTLDGEHIISQIGFYGLSPNNVPDTGATLMLFGLALGGLAIWKKN
jgi:hypothetical protein